MGRRFKRKPRLLAILTFIVFLFSMFKVWVAFSMSNLLVLENVSVLAKSETLDEGSVSFAGNKISANAVKFHAVGDYITYCVKIKNDKDENYILKSIHDDNDNGYISYFYEDYKDVKLNAGESFDFIFTETYSKAVEDIQKRQQDFSVNFYFTLKPEKENKKDDNNGTETDDTSETKINFSKNPLTGITLSFIVRWL